MLIFWDDYIIAVPTYYETEEHKHAMLHVLISSDPICVSANHEDAVGTIAFVDQDVPHRVTLKTTNSLVLFVDPSTELSDCIREKYLQRSRISVLDTPVDLSLSDKNETQIISLTKSILKKLEIFNTAKKIKDDRIAAVLNGIKSKRLLFKTVPEIAAAIALSPSRLAHLFKQETGMRLKNYLLMYKLKYAYQAVVEGKNLTEAAMDMGFSDSAHLAAVAKSTTGLSISTFFKKQ